MSKVTSMQQHLHSNRSNSNSSQSNCSNNVKLSNNKYTKKGEENMPCSEDLRKFNLSTKSDEDSSMADFRTPKKLKSKEKFKIEIGESKKKVLHGKPKTKKETNRQSRVNKPAVEFNQPSIESSFFKSLPKDIKTAFVCPLCFKTFKDEGAHMAHVKICALKNKITTKQLMEALQLQKQHAEERQSIGLLSGPVLEPKKSSTSRIKTFIANDDPELHLALALSKSLQEAEETEQLHAVEALAESVGQPLIIDSEDGRRKTLQNFGFTTNKPVHEVIDNKIRKKKHGGLTILQTRSREDKERIVTERIAEILTGNDVLSQSIYTQSQNIQKSRKTTTLSSKILQDILKTTGRLWDKTELQKLNVSSFYVNNLSNFIFPKEDLTIMYDISKYTPGQSAHMDQTTNKLMKSPLRCSNISNRQLRDSTENVETLISNWADALNDSSASDIIIFVKNGQQIWVHRLVFYVRCANILLDVVTRNDDRFPHIKDQIHWGDINHSSALAFLEFIYCGIIKRHSFVLEDKTFLTEIRCLARKYRVKSLFMYLRERQNEKINFKYERHSVLQTEISVNSNHTIEQKEQEDYDSETCVKNKCLLKEVFKNDFEHQSECEEITQLQREIEIHSNRSASASPDMFNDNDDLVHTDQSKWKEHNNFSDDENNENLKALLSLVNNDDIERTTHTEHLYRNRDIIINLKHSSVEPLTEESNENYKVNEEIIEPKDSNIISSDEKCCSPQNVDIQANKSEKVSEISAFIGKMQKYNAKSLTDLDSSLEDSPLRFNEQLRRNPFNKRWKNSYLNNEIKESPRNTKCVLSMFEESLLKQAIRTSTSMSNNNVIEPQLDAALKESEKNEAAIEICNLHNDTVLSTPEDTAIEDMSMYSRYKKNHRNNSINKYRIAFTDLNDVVDEIRNCEEQNSSQENKSLKNEETTKVKNNVIVLSDSEIVLHSSLLTEEYLDLTQRPRVKKSVCDDTCIEQDDDIDKQTKNLTNRCTMDSRKRNCNKSPITTDSNIESDNGNDINLIRKRRKVSQKTHFDCFLDLTNDLKNSGSDAQFNSTKNENTLNENELRNLSPVMIGLNLEDLEGEKVSTPTHENNHDLSFFMEFETPEFIRNDRQIAKDTARYNVQEETPKKRRQSLSPQPNRSEIRKFKTKAVSETSFRSHVLEEHKTSKMSYGNSPECTRRNKRALSDINLMDTPELKRELKKIGVKPNIKRKHAIRLLERITNQLQTRSSDSSEDEIEQSEQMEFKNGELNDLSNSINIKDAFQRLIKNNEKLYNNILTYEPIEIELVQSMLNTDNFKCNINVLMDFLDEQCITFVTQTQSTDRKRKKRQKNMD